LQDLMPGIILERNSKADFLAVLYEHLDSMKETLTDKLPGEREAWVTRDGMKRLLQACRNDPPANWWIWTLWAIYGCYGVCR
jgi:hypothetical protein